MLRTRLVKAAAVTTLALAAFAPALTAHGAGRTGHVSATTAWETAPAGKNTTAWETAPAGKNTTAWETAPAGKNTTAWE
ncbi:hypothetical protein OHU17_20195 [Streptomyces goshikiensis]|uniref:Chitinase n=2 Tax=Streptomyces goshikiensis TaxID=1942 RepID=A0ABZ1RNB7_9ACTN|nr:hypothetical protein [Streptomyces goshikiensis]GHD76743.1 hypothetical protein GCM10010336_54850 [Streptomyces goshikiensis]